MGLLHRVADEFHPSAAEYIHVQEQEVVAIGCSYGYWYFDGYQVSWSSLIVAPLLAFVADIMAYNRICADQRLLRAADRIR